MKKILNLILGFLLLIALVAFAIFAVNWLVDAFAKLNPALQTGIITAIGVIGVAIITYLANKSLETRRAVEVAIRPKKLELYQDFFTFFMRVLGKDGVVKKPSQKESIDFFIKSNPELLTFASAKVIKKWGKLRLSMGDGDMQNMFLLEDLLKDMRKDLGHSSCGHQKGDILRLFVNDIDKYLK